MSPDAPTPAPRTMPLLSVLLACRDAARHLPAALAGIEAQTYRPIELIAVDDGSTDQTPEILLGFAAKHSWVRVLRAPGVGPAAARVVAFAASQGSLIAIHDADDVSRPDRFALQVAAFESRPELGVLGSAAEVIDERGARKAPYSVPLDPEAIRRTLRRAPPFVHGSVMMRREVYEEAGGFRAGFRAAEDYDLWLRVPSRYRLENLAAPLYQWRSHSENSFHRHRNLHLEFLAIARSFADERRARGADSADLLAEAGDPDAFRSRYDAKPRLDRYRGEALIREGRVREGREALEGAFASREPATLATALAWWLLSWPVALTPRARRGSRQAARSGAAG
jgi:glycosyltransferase involved in cell wall biosynthesis